MRHLPLALAVCAPAAAQALEPILVNGLGTNSANRIWLCRDLDRDGTYNGPGEVTFYFGARAQGFHYAGDGVVFVSNSQRVVRLEDLNRDGDVADPGEALRYHEGNSSSLNFLDAHGLTFDDQGVLWVCTVQYRAVGQPTITRIEDLNGDGDGQDPGEKTETLDLLPGGDRWEFYPATIVQGQDGALYYAENSLTTFPRGVYRLDDLDGSRNFDPSTEWAPFYIPVQDGNYGYWSLDVGPDGSLFMPDYDFFGVVRLKDLDGDHEILGAERVKFYTGPEFVRHLRVTSKEHVYLTTFQEKRVLRLVDRDGDGLIDPDTDERQVVYDPLLAAVDMGRIERIEVLEGTDRIGVPDCDPAVPNSTQRSATLVALGSDYASRERITMSARSMPPQSFGLLLASTTPGTTVPPGSQGVLCLGGSIGRFPGILETGAPGASDLVIDSGQIPSGAGTVAAQPGDTFSFQVWFRDPAPGATTNFTNAVTISFR